MERTLRQLAALETELADAERILSIARSRADRASDQLNDLRSWAPPRHSSGAEELLREAREAVAQASAHRDDLRHRRDALRRELQSEEDLGSSPPGPLDVGVQLTRPISVAEVASIEVMLLELWRAVDDGGLTEGQQRQLIAMAEMIEAQRRATEPEVSERENLVVTVRAALVYLRRDFPAEAIQWSAVIALLTNANWSGLADLLSRMAP